MKTSRRHFLRGLGTMVSLPVFPSLLTGSARAAAESGSAPHRLAFVYTPNGKNMKHWKPKGAGRDYQLSRALQPLAEFKNDMTVITGMALDGARSHGDGGGDHARANAAFLTGSHPRKTAGADIKNGISVDQIAADKIGRTTRLPSLELSCDEPMKAGNCDSGYSCAYQFNLSWRSESMPMTPERDPKEVFERLFGADMTGLDKNARLLRDARHRSVLDFVLDDAKSLQSHLGKRDQEKLDEYLTSVRQIERRIGDSESVWEKLPSGLHRPGGIPHEYPEHIRLMYDMLVLAFQTDSTRVASFLLAHDGSNRTFPTVGVNEAHHGISHHQNNPERLEGLAKIDEFYCAEFARFLGKLRSIKEGDRSLLDNTSIVYGSGISDPDRHAHHDLPIILAGGAPDRQHSIGQHIDLGNETPLTNLYLSLLHRVGAKEERFGDSTGLLTSVC